MAGWRDTWYPNAVDAMRSLRGTGGAGADGSPLPLTQAIDTLAIIAQFPRPLAEAIRRFQRSASDGFVFGPSDLADRAINSSLVYPDGTTRPLSPADVLAGKLGDSITIDDYLAGFPDERAPWLRSPSSSDEFYSLWIPDSAGAEVALLALHREAVRAWSAAVAVSTDMLIDYGANLQAEMAANRNARFWTAIRQLCTALDVIAANPPETNAQKIVGAVKVALSRSGEVAGQGAAHIAEAIGNTAGSAAKGFLDTANMTAVVVAGIAIFLLAS
jgi:hypothetical protein